MIVEHEPLYVLSPNRLYGNAPSENLRGESNTDNRAVGSRLRSPDAVPVRGRCVAQGADTAHSGRAPDRGRPPRTSGERGFQVTTRRNRVPRRVGPKTPHELWDSKDGVSISWRVTTTSVETETLRTHQARSACRPCVAVRSARNTPVPVSANVPPT